MAEPGSSRDLHILTEGGRRDDVGLHDEILRNPSADRQLADAAIQRALDQGLSEDEARALYDTQRS